MSSHPPPSIELEFARRYDQEHARVCGEPRPAGLGARLAHWRMACLVRHALNLAGEPGLILDVACGAGRYWPVLAEHGNRVILAADPSQDMLNHAQTHHPASLMRRVKTFHSSAFDIGLPANAVDSIICMQLFAHVSHSEDRLALLQEFHRVSRDSVIIATRVEPLVNVRGAASAGPAALRPVSKGLLEGEFKQADFEVLGHQDLLPGFGALRVYVLRKHS
ncbi:MULTISPECIES: class I SAM-dependent methyltransferase [Pseudomonas]|uniref:Class I SAM-dependent methyltransferase n=1 Tax=Pseudomonas protegens TaxID=380021 RepID=A0A2T6GNZ2_9PSED|nr:MULTISPECIES: class I SAM-dependent methyltransferase [Pseudomonas]PUA45862.1 class I SAM-dependent methyltransferase [Pseudomonas protegens]RXU69854.1 class I SAM-dependent methyltransferase [Pseudomonas protegens]ULT69308.1 class I SAM-dependent methyltransferase [Pseudomonas sp. BC42]BAQ73199.1 SAM-dependent methyltransferase [Pseudomonas sp. Os17]BAQ79435.1 SAM-dependent methyltransferase [Pseudomonas sp. St29]